MSVLYNISNHRLTEEQRKGFNEVIEMPESIAKRWKQMSPITTRDTLDRVCKWISNSEHTEDELFHIAGYPPAVAMLLDRLYGDECIFAHSIRDSEEYIAEDGSVQKKNVFRFEGWYHYSDLSKVVL